MNLKFGGWSWKTILLHYIKLCASFQIHRQIQTGATVWKRSIRVKIGNFVPCDLEIWWMTLKNNRAPLLCCFKLCASFHSHHWIQTGGTVRKRPIWVKIGDYLSPCDLEIGWLTVLKTIRHLFHTTLSFVHHFKAIGEFKLELKSWNAQFGSKSAIFLSPVTFKFDGWPLKTSRNLFYTTWSFVHHFKAIGEFKLESQSGNTWFGSKSTIF